MLIGIDIGNSFIKTGVYEDANLIAFERFESIEELVSYVQKYTFKKIGISSVFPKMTLNVSEALINKFNIQPYIVTISSKLHLELNYETPQTLGIDRICGAEGALKLYEKEFPNSSGKHSDIILSVDLGTATTINIIKHQKIFIGGIIAPGINLMNESLTKNTAQLPRVELQQNIPFLGTSTVTSIQSGILNSTIGLIERIRNKLLNEGRVFSYITGGNAKIIIPNIEFEHQFVEDLVLMGIQSIYNLNNE